MVFLVSTSSSASSDAANDQNLASFLGPCQSGFYGGCSAAASASTRTSSSCKERKDPLEHARSFATNADLLFVPVDIDVKIAVCKARHVHGQKRRGFFLYRRGRDRRRKTAAAAAAAVGDSIYHELSYTRGTGTGTGTLLLLLRKFHLRLVMTQTARHGPRWNADRSTRTTRVRDGRSMRSGKSCHGSCCLNCCIDLLLYYLLMRSIYIYDRSVSPPPKKIMIILE